MVAFPGNGAQRRLSERLVGSQIRLKGVSLRNWQQLLERINASESERKAATLFGSEWKHFPGPVRFSRISRETLGSTGTPGAQPGAWCVEGSSEGWTDRCSRMAPSFRNC